MDMRLVTDFTPLTLRAISPAFVMLPLKRLHDDLNRIAGLTIELPVQGRIHPQGQVMVLGRNISRARSLGQGTGEDQQDAQEKCQECCSAVHGTTRKAVR